MCHLFQRILWFGLALLFISQPLAFGHGFAVSLINNQINAQPEDELNFSNHIFFAPFDQFNDHTYFTDHGSVEAKSGSGINPSTDTLQIEFLGALWYSNGGAAQRATSDLTLEATSYNSFGGELGNPVDITGTSVSPSGFQVSGTDPHSIGWELSNNPNTAPAIPQGVYGFAYRVAGYKNSNMSTPFESSVPLVVVFDTPDFDDDTNLGSAQLAIFSAIMRGDFNLDGQRSAADIPDMLGAFVNLSAYQTSFDLSDADVSAIADVDQNGVVTNADLQAMLDLLKSGEGQTNPVPEPSTAVMASIAMFLAGRWWRKNRSCG